MKKIFILIFSGAIFLVLRNFLFASNTQVAKSQGDTSTASTLYHIALKSLDGKNNIDLSSFKGKKLLIVNTASECGYTPQYEGLQNLYEKMKDKLVIIGCPCNQFGEQEPGDTSQIRSFCQKNYGVTFLISEKLDVKGKDQHPLYKWLTQKSENGVLESEVRWNFNKYLIDSEGHLLAYFPSKVKPDDPELIKLINQ